MLLDDWGWQIRATSNRLPGWLKWPLISNYIQTILCHTRNVQPPCVSMKPMMYCTTDISWLRAWSPTAIDTSMWWSDLLSICSGTSDTTDDIILIKFGQVTLSSLFNASQLKERKSFFFLNKVPEPGLQIPLLSCCIIPATAFMTNDGFTATISSTITLSTLTPCRIALQILLWCSCRTNVFFIWLG